MKIQRIEVIPLAGNPALGQASAVHAIVRISTDAGLVGIGRVPAPHKSIVDEWLAPLLIGENPLNVERLWNTF